jgi:branched-chain amino acid transport system ATP-binding protein
MLLMREINLSYGKLQTLWDLRLTVGDESVGLFGPNGAGKTSLINAILGLVKPSSGEISFNGEAILPLATHERIRRRIAVVPQDRDLFPMMSVLENLRSGASYVPGARDKLKTRLDLVFSMFPILQERSSQAAGTMSGGQQRMLAIGRALMADPKLLILDEPTCGLQPSLVSELFLRLRDIRQQGVSLLIAEQNVRQCLKAIDRGYVIENGRIILEDKARNLTGNDHVRKSYLGL